MAKLSLSPAFIKDSLWVVRKRGFKALIFGSRAPLSRPQRQLLDQLKRDWGRWRKLGARRGPLAKVDLVHKGQGTAYLVPDSLDPGQSDHRPHR